MFLTDDLSTQIGTFALTPQIVDAVGIPVIATGRVAAALTLGASAVQLGTAYLFCPDAEVSDSYRTALYTRGDTQP